MSTLAALRKYGPTGIGTYLVISTCTTATLYTAIQNHVDLHGLLRWAVGDKADTRALLERWGIKPAEPGAGAAVASSVTSGVLALAISKALIPIKVPLAMVVTPYVHRFLVARGALKV